MPHCGLERSEFIFFNGFALKGLDLDLSALVNGITLLIAALGKAYGAGVYAGYAADLGLTEQVGVSVEKDRPI